jgi:hypothetical protein
MRVKSPPEIKANALNKCIAIAITLTVISIRQKITIMFWAVLKSFIVVCIRLFVYIIM